MSSNPFTRYSWNGIISSLDDASTQDFGPDDCDEIIAEEEWGGRWDGYMAGVARLKDGRFIAWDDSYGPTGDGLSRDAYGGDATIYVGETLDTVVRFGLGEEARLRLGFDVKRPEDAVLPQPPPKHAEGDVWAEIINALREEDPNDELLPYCIARRQMGIDKYGTPLQRENGRDHSKDALQEALDGMAYALAEYDHALLHVFSVAARMVVRKLHAKGDE